MKTQGSFDYKVNGENKTKEEIDNMDLSNMNCTVDGLFISYSFPRKNNIQSVVDILEKEAIQYSVDVNPSPEKVQDIKDKILYNNMTPNLVKYFSIIEAKNEEELNKILNTPHKKETIRTKTDDTKGGILKGSEFLYQRLSEKDDVIINNSRGEKEMIGHFQGIKESQSTEKAPIFTYCKVNKNALEALSLRALYGHKKYNINGADEDWQNFTRVPNAEEEYSNAQFRHALEIGGEETEKEHLVSAAWNAVAKLEIYLRKDLEKSK